MQVNAICPQPEPKIIGNDVTSGSENDILLLFVIQIPSKVSYNYLLLCCRAVEYQSDPQFDRFNSESDSALRESYLILCVIRFRSVVDYSS